MKERLSTSGQILPTNSSRYTTPLRLLQFADTIRWNIMVLHHGFGNSQELADQFHDFLRQVVQNPGFRGMG